MERDPRRPAANLSRSRSASRFAARTVTGWARTQRDRDWGGVTWILATTRWSSSAAETTQTIERVTRLLEDAIEDGDGPVLSVFAEPKAPGESVESVTERICRTADLPHSRILVSSAPRLASAQLHIVRSIDDGEAVNHHHVVFREPLDPVQIQAYVQCWDAPRPNPTSGKRPIP